MCRGHSRPSTVGGAPCPKRRARTRRRRRCVRTMARTARRAEWLQKVVAPAVTAAAGRRTAGSAGRSLRSRFRGGHRKDCTRSRRRRRRDSLARALLLLRGLRFWSMVGSSRGQRGKGSRVTARDRVDGRKRRRERRREEDSRGKTDCRRVASGTHHALVIARLPIGIGHPCAHAGLVYVRKRLEAGPRPSSRLPRARTRPARRFPGGSAAGKSRAPACRNP